MRYHLRIARLRPQGSVDTKSTAFSAPTIECAVTHSVKTIDSFLGDQPGVATLTSAYRGLVWSRRQKMPGHPFP
jgi:hypothetical protein